MGSNREKKPWTNLQNSYKNWSKEIKSDNLMGNKNYFDGSNNIFADCIFGVFAYHIKCFILQWKMCSIHSFQIKMKVFYIL